MKASFWHERWERAEIAFHKQNVDLHLQQLWNRLNLRTGQRVFVPLCGKSLDMLWLAGEGHPVTGVELSPLAVEAFFDENRLLARRSTEGGFHVWEAEEIRILNGDFFDLEPAHLADCAAFYDQASLIALPPAMRAEYVRHLDAVLPPGASGLLMTLEYDQAMRPGPPFSVSEAEVRMLFEPAYDVELLLGLDALAKGSHFSKLNLDRLQADWYLLARR